MGPQGKFLNMIDKPRVGVSYTNKMNTKLICRENTKYFFKRKCVITWNWKFLCLMMNSCIQIFAWTWNTMRLLGSTIHMFLLRDNIQEIRKEPRMCTENKLLWFKWYIGEIGKSFSIELKFVNCSEI